MSDEYEQFLYYFRDNYTDEQYRYLKAARKYNIDYRYLLDTRFNSFQLREIIIGLIQRIDINLYYNLNFSASQMKQIRLGILDGIDATVYAIYNLPSRKMKRIRRVLTNEMYGRPVRKNLKDTNQYNVFEVNVQIETLTNKLLTTQNDLNFDQMLDDDTSLDDLFNQ